MADWKYHAKFVGKLVTYLGLIPASAGMTVTLSQGFSSLTATPFVVGAIGTLMVIVGCATHEYSE